MTAEEIQQGNELIAAFHGYKNETPYVNRDGDKFPWYVMRDEQGKIIRDVKYLPEYDKDWNWLMEVIEKIESSADNKTGHIEFEIMENHCTLYRMDFKPIIKTYNSASKILSAHEAVCKFIKWYHQQNKTP